MFLRIIQRCLSARHAMRTVPGDWPVAPLCFARVESGAADPAPGTHPRNVDPANRRTMSLVAALGRQCEHPAARLRAERARARVLPHAGGCHTEPGACAAGRM